MAFEYGLYSPGRSFVHSLDARAKMLLLPITIGFSIANDQLLDEPLFGLLVYSSNVGFLALSRPRKFWFAALAGVSAVIGVSNSIFWPLSFQNAGNLVFTLPLLDWRYTDFGLITAWTKMFLVLNPVVAAMIIFVTTRPYFLLQGLVRMGIPYKAGFILSLALRFLPVSINETRAIMDAQMSRGLEFQKGSPVTRIRNFIPIFLPLVVRMIRNTVELSVALESRYFGAVGKRIFLAELEWRKTDTVFLSGVVLLYVSAFAVMALW